MGRSNAAQREELEDGNRDCNVDGYWHCGGDRAAFGNHQDIQKMIRLSGPGRFHRQKELSVVPCAGDVL